MSAVLEGRRARRAATKRRGYYVYFFGWMWEPEPIFHRRGKHHKIMGGPRDGEHETLTGCGLVTWRSHTGRPSRVVELPAFHGEKIGRPCKRCFP